MYINSLEKILGPFSSKFHKKNSTSSNDSDFDCFVRFESSAETRIEIKQLLASLSFSTQSFSKKTFF